MKAKSFVIAALVAALLPATAGAQDKPNIKLYGFIRNYFAFDTRESSAGTEDLFFYMPKDESIVDGVDLNAIPSFRFAALTSRLGLDLTGYEAEGYKIGAKFETDFYSGVSGVTGTAQLRLRQAYVTVAKDARTWKIGQAWHPMAADMPDIFSLETGAPFGPFSRTPQVNFETKLGEGGSSITAAAIWQMQYTSPGPDGNSANYIKYGLTPELYFGYNVKTSKGLFRIGADVLSIKPRNYGEVDGKKVLVSDRVTTASFFAYGQQTVGDLVVKAKATYGNDGSHMNLVGGYGYTTQNADGSRDYVGTHNVSAWATLQYKKSKKVVPSVLFGYVQNLGTSADVVESYTKLSCGSLKSMYRIQPEVVYNIGKLQIGLEYMLTGVQYGKGGKRIMAEENLHWVANNRIQSMVKYTF